MRLMIYDTVVVLLKLKVDVLSRAAGIHEKYLAQIERKINQPQHVAA